MELSEYRNIKEALMKDLDEVFSRYNLRRYRVDVGVEPTMGMVKFKIDTQHIKTQNEDPPHVKRWYQFAKAYGLPEDALGKYFRHNGSIYTIKGISDVKSDKNILANSQRGKGYRFSPDQVLRGLPK